MIQFTISLEYVPLVPLHRPLPLLLGDAVALEVGQIGEEGNGVALPIGVGGAQGVLLQAQSAQGFKAPVKNTTPVNETCFVH